MLKINNLIVSADNKIIINGLDLNINDSEIHVLMGQNGTGKSTISKVLLHHPDYQIEAGKIVYNDTILNDLDTTEISRLGIFLLSQNPIEIEGLTNSEMLRNAISEKNNEKVDIFKFNKKLNEVCKIIDMQKNYIHRDINFNMSGGEKKKNELLHLFMLEPKFIILDEIDSGLDIDALKIVGDALKKYYDEYKPSILIITHHAEILNYFDEYKVHILHNGKIIKSGNKDLIKEIENVGFKANVISGNDINE